MSENERIVQYKKFIYIGAALFLFALISIVGTFVIIEHFLPSEKIMMDIGIKKGQN